MNKADIAWLLVFLFAGPAFVLSFWAGWRIAERLHDRATNMDSGSDQ